MICFVVYLGHPAVGHSVAAERGLCGPVPESSLGSWAAVAAIPELPPVALTGGVGRPCAVGRAHRVNVSTGRAIKPGNGSYHKNDVESIYSKKDA